MRSRSVGRAIEWLVDADARRRFHPSDPASCRSGACAVAGKAESTQPLAASAETSHHGRSYGRDRLGLLGRIASAVCLIEIYGHAPSAEEFRACLAKHIAFWQKRAREARAHNRKRRQQRQLPEAFRDPSLWIIAAGSPAAILTKLELKPARGWPAGVYFFGDDVLRVGIVVASELPRNRSTILVRLMAAGPLLAPAVEDRPGDRRPSREPLPEDRQVHGSEGSQRAQAASSGRAAVNVEQAAASA
jgi:hypothetical protein